MQEVIDRIVLPINISHQLGIFIMPVELDIAVLDECDWSALFYQKHNLVESIPGAIIM